MRDRGVVVTLIAALVLGGCGDAAADRADDGPVTVGMLRIVSDENHGDFVDELRRQGLRVGIDVVLLPSDPEELYGDAAAAEAAVHRWLRGDLDLVVAFSTPFAQLVAGLEVDVPGLFVVNDPLAAGLVDDRRRPEGRMTGVTFRTPADRTLSLASEALGGLSRVGYLFPSGDPAVPGHRAAFLAAAEQLDIELVEASFAEPADVAAAAAVLAAADVEAVVIANSNATFRAQEALRAALDEHRLPAIGTTDILDFAVLVLTPDGAELRRQLARQAARILQGADVANVPVEDPRKFLLILNRTKARELGLGDIPDGLLRQADVVR